MSDLLEPKDVRLFLVAIGGMFIYILVSNLMGLVPGFLPPTDKMTHNAAIALTSFFLFMGWIDCATLSAFQAPYGASGCTRSVNFRD